MKLKTWLTFSYVLMALMVLSVSGFGIYFIEKLINASDNILKDNYESVFFSEHMINALEEIDNNLIRVYFGTQYSDGIENKHISAKMKFLENLKRQENNITEPMEAELTNKVKKMFEEYISLCQKTPDSAKLSYYYNIITPRYNSVKGVCYDILYLNKAAIIRKNNEAKRISKDVEFYMLLISVISLLIVIIALIKIPNIIINPILELTGKVKEVSEKKYSQKLDVKSNNELGHLAEEFNLMAAKLSEYEKSNIAKFIAEKKRAETIVKSMRDGILVVNELNEIVLMNSVSEELFGITENNILGNNIFEVSKYNNLINVVSQDLDKEQDQIKSNGRSQNYFRISFKDKEEFFLKEITKVFDEHENKFLGYIILLKNVTGFKELDEIKSGFVATVSHELRTPLTAMSMSLRLLQDKRIGDISEEQSKLIDAMKQEVKRLLKIVNELLNLSKIESGSEIMKYQIVPIEDLLDAAVTPLLMQFDQKKIKFDMKIESNIPPLKVDANKIAWVLINLLSNAIRYTPEQEKISIFVTSKNSEVLFSVKDSGKGIESKNINKVFEKFAQFDSKNLESNRSGVGLGLSISKEFVNAHGGKIWVESEIGKGTTFYFTVPIRN